LNSSDKILLKSDSFIVAIFYTLYDAEITIRLVLKSLIQTFDSVRTHYYMNEKNITLRVKLFYLSVCRENISERSFVIRTFTHLGNHI